MKLEAEQPCFGAGHRVLLEHPLRDRDDVLGADRPDAEIERSGFARGVDPGLYSTHILLDDRILSRDPPHEDAAEPSLDRRQIVEQGAVAIDQLQPRGGLGALADDARQLAPWE